VNRSSPRTWRRTSDLLSRRRRRGALEQAPHDDRWPPLSGARAKAHCARLVASRLGNARGGERGLLPRRARQRVSVYRDANGSRPRPRGAGLIRRASGDGGNPPRRARRRGSGGRRPYARAAGEGRRAPRRRARGGARRGLLQPAFDLVRGAAAPRAPPRGALRPSPALEHEGLLPPLRRRHRAPRDFHHRRLARGSAPAHGGRGGTRSPVAIDGHAAAALGARDPLHSSLTPAGTHHDSPQ